jgi:hypothetical protein
VIRPGRHGVLGGPGKGPFPITASMYAYLNAFDRYLTAEGDTQAEVARSDMADALDGLRDRRQQEAA